MFGWKVFLLVLFTSLTSSLADTNYVTVRTPLGKVRGTVMHSRKNQPFYAFRGVRYAQPPIGERRFRAPKPIDPWSGTYDATKEGYICPQPSPKIDQSLVSEDCLTLNVFTKDLNASLPVMVYIFGGGFQTGGSHTEIFWGPQYLMDKDIVFVIINYRLGALGFMSTGTKDAPGNYGFKDQVMALRWVRDNIKAFGGDPNMVTLWGHSSGAMSVTLHMVSPMSQGLFHRLIAMSASATSHALLKSRETTDKLARKVGCYSTIPKVLVECLRHVPYNDTVTWTWSSNGVLELLWNYEIEVDHGQERFMPEHPTTLYAQGKFRKIPILVGVTNGEFRAQAYEIYNDSETFNEFSNNFSAIAPKAFIYSPELVNFTKAIKSTYFNDKKITWDNLDQLGAAFDDAFVQFGVHRLVALTRKRSPVFYYQQDFEGRYSGRYGNDGKPIGVYHSDDLQYLFVHKAISPMFTEADPENIMVEKLTELWTTFARTGNPNNHTNPWTSDINWKPSNSTALQMLHINKNSFMSGEPHQKRFKLWDKFFPITFK